MKLGAVVSVLEQMAAASTPLDAAVLSECMASNGWSPASVPIQLVPRNWSYGELRASIYSEDGDDFVDFAFRVIPPDWDLPEYTNAVETEYVREIDRTRTISEEIAALLAEAGVVAGAISTDDLEESLDFIEKNAWIIGACSLTVGVLHPDEDAPIILLAKARFQ